MPNAQQRSDFEIGRHVGVSSAPATIGRSVDCSRSTCLIVTTYIDEAGTHGTAPHMIMGALVGRLGQWADFDKKWRKMLRRNGISYFHSKKLKHTDGPFKGWSRPKKIALIATASDIQRDTTLFGLSVKIRQPTMSSITNLASAHRRCHWIPCTAYVSDMWQSLLWIQRKKLLGEKISNLILSLSLVTKCWRCVPRFQPNEDCSE